MDKHFIFISHVKRIHCSIQNHLYVFFKLIILINVIHLILINISIAWNIFNFISRIVTLSTSYLENARFYFTFIKYVKRHAGLFYFMFAI